ncbi:MAG: hypothetical protein ABIP16_07960 [Thermomonas sp.]
MDITIYRAPDGRYILVPEVFQPSSECRHRFGILTHCGEVDIADTRCAATARQVLADIERDSYAMLEAAAAHVLLGPGHRCLAVESAGELKRPSEAVSYGHGVSLDTPVWDEG